MCAEPDRPSLVWNVASTRKRAPSRQSAVSPGVQVEEPVGSRQFAASPESGGATQAETVSSSPIDAGDALQVPKAPVSWMGTKAAFIGFSNSRIAPVRVS